jgi:hypothetical protein
VEVTGVGRRQQGERDGRGGDAQTLARTRVYTAESVDADPTGMKLFASLMVMIRANT